MPFVFVVRMMKGMKLRDEFFGQWNPDNSVEDIGSI